VRKGADPHIDSYSGFFDNGQRQATGLESLLKAHAVTAVYLLGLATDYCVQFTALDALSLGFATYIVTDGCRGVNVQPGDAERAMAAMQQQGAILVCSGEVPSQLRI